MKYSTIGNATQDDVISTILSYVEKIRTKKDVYGMSTVNSDINNNLYHRDYQQKHMDTGTTTAIIINHMTTIKTGGMKMSITYLEVMIEVTIGIIEGQKIFTRSGQHHGRGEC